MTALKDMPISFPGLFGGWEFNPDPVALHVGHGIYWYGIILALASLAGMLLCMKLAPRYGLTEDNVLDLVLWAVPCCILGSRIYYVVFYLDLYRNAAGGLDWGRIIAIWDGGLAIYGTVIAGALVAFLYARRKKIRFGAMADLAVMGLLLGQIIGRWANFINREAFGGPTELPWRMRLWVSQYQFVEVHPTFLYESLWNLLGLGLILFIVSRGRRFDGENTWFYFLWYGLGRSWIEGLRTDSLYLFDWTFLGQPIRVSQALSLVMACVAAVMLFYNIRIRKALPENLLVNRLAAEAEARAEAEAAEAAARMQADARLEAGVLSAAPAAGLRGGEEDCPPPEGEKPEGEEPVGEKPVGEKPEGEKPKEDKPNGGMD
ncbi:prolipoprotein diacylglyceryl transferase [uncultured Oscillibacter sp.]|uniref:prolipoprotein diacylglyceryl transferase n=1 Tax=uncultured Oscillibacter sp. TaxID=876091 RepID=UPI00262711DF|nr:prolipoprotein diacylglyceryl transferase [uncultured Oscillibacter sp.]